jgi:signal transduction histidine kinase
MAANESAGPKPIVSGDHVKEAASDAIRRDDALRRAVRLSVVQELADEMAHELNNVLTVIAGSLQLFLMQQGGETAQHHFVRNAIEASLRGAQMTGNLLAHASPQVIEATAFGPAGLVQTLAPVLRETLGRQLTLDISGVDNTVADDLLVRADRRFVESALMALCQLAAGQARAPGQVAISCAQLSAAEALRQSGALVDGAAPHYVLLSLEAKAPGLSPEPVRQALTPALGARPPAHRAERAAFDLSAAYASLRQCGGDIGAEALPGTPSGFVVAMLLPGALAA